MKKIEVGFVNGSFGFFNGDYWELNTDDNFINIYRKYVDEKLDGLHVSKIIASLQYSQIIYIAFKENVE